MIEGKNFIGNKKKAEGKISYATFNPKLNMDNPWYFYQASPEEIEEAVEKATKAFRLYKKTSGKQRAAFLRTIADEIENLGEDLIQAYVAESGLPEGRALGERGRTVNQLRAFAKVAEDGTWVNATIDKAQPDRKPNPKPDIRKMNMPLGPVAVFGASNFPLAFSTAGGDTASAFASGCPVLVKSHPMHAGTSELVANAIVKAIEKTNMPDGVFSHIHAKENSIGELLVKNDGIKAVGFTGSFNGGMALHKLASERKEPIPVFAEMGSINPVVILPKALQEKGQFWAKKYAESINLGAGQFCTNPGLLLGIDSPQYETFANLLSQELLEQEAGCMLHPDIALAYNDGKQKMLNVPEVEMLAMEFEQGGDNFGRQVLVKVSGEAFKENPELHREVFGPFSMLVVCKDEYELATLVSQLEGQLTGTVLCEGAEAVAYPEVLDALQSKVGRLVFNGVPTGVEVCAAMQHGGPYPATSDPRYTSVGMHAIERWVRPIAFQDCPEALLPDALKDENPLRIIRQVNGEFTRSAL